MPLKGLLDNLLGTDAETQQPDPEQRRRLAAAVLLVEIAQSDFQLERAELAAICDGLAEQFGLSAEEARALVDEARDEHADHTSLEPYVTVLNDSASREEKRELLEALWRVAYADGELHRYEEHMLRRVADLMFLSHADFIRTKLKVQGKD